MHVAAQHSARRIVLGHQRVAVIEEARGHAAADHLVEPPTPNRLSCPAHYSLQTEVVFGVATSSPAQSVAEAR